MLLKKIKRGLWKSANWLEREVWDLYGVRFKDHPDLRRIMLDDRWVGHPLRKDYHIKKYQRWEDSLEMKSAGFDIIEAYDYADGYESQGLAKPWMTPLMPHTNS